MTLQLILFPLGLYGSVLGAVVGVVSIYLHGELKIQWRRLVVELVVACILSGAVAEKLLPINSFLVCASVALFIGGATGVVLDLWQKVAPSFAMNIFNKFSKMFTGAELPKDAIEKSEKKDFKDDK